MTSTAPYEEVGVSVYAARVLSYNCVWLVHVVSILWPPTILCTFHIWSHSPTVEIIPSVCWCLATPGAINGACVAICHTNTAPSYYPRNNALLSGCIPSAIMTLWYANFGIHYSLGYCLVLIVVACCRYWCMYAWIWQNFLFTIPEITPFSWPPPFLSRMHTGLLPSCDIMLTCLLN